MQKEREEKLKGQIKTLKEISAKKSKSQKEVIKDYIGIFYSNIYNTTRGWEAINKFPEYIYKNVNENKAENAFKETLNAITKADGVKNLQLALYKNMCSLEVSKDKDELTINILPLSSKYKFEDGKIGSQRQGNDEAITLKNLTFHKNEMDKINYKNFTKEVNNFIKNIDKYIPLVEKELNSIKKEEVKSKEINSNKAEIQPNKQNLIELPLDEILIKNGYYEKRNKSSRNYKTLTNDQDDTIIISRQSNGHYLYFNPNDDSDRGNIYNFTKNRGIRANDLLSSENIDINKLKSSVESITTISQSSRKAIENYKNLEQIAENSFLTTARKISPEILKEFNDLKQDNKYGNAVVPSYICKNYSYKDSEIQLLIQAGSISYLSKPLTQDTQGKLYDKPIKQLCNGSKGLEILKANDSQKNLKDFKNIVICESMIDTLSYCELKGLNLKETLLCSTNGQITSSQKEVFKFLNEKAVNANIILGFDNDKKGKEFDVIAKEIIPRATTDKAILKDFSDDLVIGKTLGLKANEISKESLTKPLNDFSKKVEYLSKKYEFLEPQAKHERVKELFGYNIPKFKDIAPKIQPLAGMRDCFKRLKLLENKISNEYSRRI